HFTASIHLCMSVEPLLPREYSSIFFYIFLMIVFTKDPATTEIYTLSLHDALPISKNAHSAPEKRCKHHHRAKPVKPFAKHSRLQDRKSTRLKLQSRFDLVCRLLLEKKNKKN